MRRRHECGAVKRHGPRLRGESRSPRRYLTPIAATGGSDPDGAAKSNVSLIECGVLSFEVVFMPFMVTDSGRPVIEQVQHLLPKPEEQKVVPLSVA